jgi:hypothetical protein
MVPGRPLAAWSGPHGGSLVLYRTLPVPGGDAASVAEALANRLSNLPDLKVCVRRTEHVVGTTAARVEVIAPGTGDALAPSGTGPPTAPAGKSLVATHQVTLAFVRPDETLHLTWHVPEARFQELTGEIEATISALRFTSSGAASRYSK